MSIVNLVQEETLAERVGGEVRGLCARFHLKQSDLARLLNISQGSVSLRFRGAQPFQLHEIEMLAEYFGTTAQVLMGFETEPRPRKPMSPEQWCAHRGSNPGPEDSGNVVDLASWRRDHGATPRARDCSCA